MTEPVVLLDPTGEFAADAVNDAPRLAQVAGSTIALLDIAKPRGSIFLDRIEDLLRQRGATVVRYRKESYARVADDSLAFAIAARAHAVNEALAD